jgi:hypothetical protein
VKVCGAIEFTCEDDPDFTWPGEPSNPCPLNPADVIVNVPVPTAPAVTVRFTVVSVYPELTATVLLGIDRATLGRFVPKLFPVIVADVGWPTTKVVGETP